MPEGAMGCSSRVRIPAPPLRATRSGSLPAERTGLCQPVLVREGVQLEPVCHAELLVDGSKMVAQRMLADAEFLGDHLRRGAGIGGRQGDDLAFPHRKLGDPALLGAD